jgi:hypothetical protein
MTRPSASRSTIKTLRIDFLDVSPNVYTAGGDFKRVCRVWLRAASRTGPQRAVHPSGCPGAGSPFHIFLFRQFFAGFPKELEDAAKLDGCSRPRVFSQIFLPNAGPVLAASAIFAFQWVWGDFFLQSIFLNESHATLGH